MRHTTTTGAMALIALVSCTEADLASRETGDLGYTGAYGIESVERDCTPGDTDKWSFEVRTMGWAHAIDLHVLEASTSASETHPLSNTDYDPAGSWDLWEATLLAAPSEADAQAGATTAWGCEETPGLAWQVVMYAVDDPETAIDCAAWGAQASQVMAGPAGLVCDCVEEDGDCAD